MMSWGVLIRGAGIFDGSARPARDLFGCHQLVNGSGGVVERVYVAGQRVWHGTAFTGTFGRKRAGQALTAKGWQI